jgi:hypothetical protein
MPEATTPEGVSSKALESDPGVTIPRLQLGEQGVLGLKTSNGRILEEAQAAFRYPAFIQTVNEMRNNPTVGAAMNVWRMMISRVKWDVEPPTEGSDVDQDRAKLIKTMMNDMEHSWESFIEGVVPYLEYGFAVNEVVLRRRLTRNGSKYNDGLVGIRRLPTRAQETIHRWNFSDDGSTLLSIEQNPRYLDKAYLLVDRLNNHGMLTIDRNKILLFTASATKGNPEGNSIYKPIYLAFKQLVQMQNQEILGIVKDVQGILRIGIPAAYLAPDASDDKKAVAQGFQSIIDNYNAGTARGLLVPEMYDDQGKPLFTYNLLESKGQAKYDTEAVIKRLQTDILSALSVDILKLGAEGSGSFSLAESKSSVLAMAIDYRLREIQSVLNNELMPKLYAFNGWEQTNMAQFRYQDVEDVDLDLLSKFIQRVASTSMIEVDRPVMNRIRKAFGVPELPADEPVNRDILSATLTGQETNASEGMEVGTTGDGTSKTVSGKDKSTANKENA